MWSKKVYSIIKEKFIIDLEIFVFQSSISENQI